MSPKYVIVECGMPHVAPELPRFDGRMTRRSILERGWEDSHAFDGAYSYQVVADPPEISWFAKVLAYSTYDPLVPVAAQWNRSGSYEKCALIGLVADGLEHDDDIIQQWFSADHVLRLLNAANCWDEMLLAVEAICGSHEVDPSVERYVLATLDPAA